MRSRLHAWHGAAAHRASVALPAALACLTAIVLASAAHAASITATIDPPQMLVGETAQLTVTIEGERTAPAPRITRVDGLVMRSFGQTTSMQIVNGQISSDVTHTFAVQAERAGTFTIPPIEIRVGDQTLRSAALTLRVDAEPGAPQGGAGAGAGAAGGSGAGVGAGTGIAPGAGGAPGAGDTSGADAPHDRRAAGETPVAKLEIARLPQRDVFVGELLPAEIHLLVREGVRLSEVTPVKLSGSAFTLTQPREQQPAVDSVTLGAIRYTRYRFPVAFSPVAAGQQELAISMEATGFIPEARRRRGGGLRGGGLDPFDDPFFDGFLGAARAPSKIPLTSGALPVAVRELPQEGRPADFSGGIGRFSVSAKASPTKVSVGDPITMTVTVSGEGSFDRLDLPPLERSADWKTYDQSTKVETTNDVRQVARKTFEQAIVPEHDGIDAIPARRLSYFDPERARYVSVSTQPIKLEVAALEPGRPGARIAGGAASGAKRGGGRDARAASAALDIELAPNQIALGELRPSLAPVALTPGFVLLQVLALALMGGTIAWAARRTRLATDPAHLRALEMQRAVRVEMERMQRAVAARDASSFFAAARRAVQERVATDATQAASLTLPEIEARLEPTPELRGRLHDLFTAADAVAYSRGAANGEPLESWQARVRELLRMLDVAGAKR